MLPPHHFSNSVNASSQEGVVAEIIVLQPLKETLVLRSEASHKAEALLAAMIQVARELARIACEPDADLNALNEQKISLAKELAALQDRIQMLSDLCDLIHEKRAEVWEAMPNEKPGHIVASNSSFGRVYVLTAERHAAKVICTQLELFELDDAGCFSRIDLHIRRRAG
jgi:hypothetical protein